MSRLIIFLLFFAFLATAQAQTCKTISHTIYADWKDVSNPIISPNGKYFAFEWKPQKGDGSLIIYHVDNGKYDTISRAGEAVFFPDSKGMVFKIKPPYHSLRKQQLDGVKKEKLLKDSLGIKYFSNDSIIKMADVKTIKVATKEGNIMAWLHEESYKPKADTAKRDSTLSKKKVSKKVGPTSEIKKSYLSILNIPEQKIWSVDQVTEFEISENGSRLAYIRQTNDSIDSTFVYTYFMGLQKPLAVYKAKGISKNIGLDLHGRQLSFVFSSDTGSRKIYSLGYMGLKDNNARIVIDSLHPAISSELTISEHYKPRFSDDGSALYLGLGLKPAKRFRDSLTADEKVSMDIWNWKDGQLQSQQLKNVEKDQKNSFLSVYYPVKNTLIRLGNESVPNVQPDFKQHQNTLIGFNAKPYEHLTSWEQKRYVDVFAVNRNDGTSKLLLKKADAMFRLSPSSAYLLYYKLSDSSWNSMHIQSNKHFKLTDNSADAFYDVTNDVPTEANAYGFAGWIEPNKAVVYSRHNLWMLDLSGKTKPILLTHQSDEKKLTYRYINLDKEEILMPRHMYLSVFDEASKQSGFATLDVSKLKLETKIAGDARFTALQKATSGETYVFRKETFEHYPDFYLSGNDFRASKKISNANPQQAEYCWGSVRMVKWTSLNGENLEGLLYFPANFSADSSYPMIVYFYEKHSDDLHRHYAPRPSRSIVNMADYTSRGYFVFAPDIEYQIPLPGQSAYNAIMSGVRSMLERFRQINPQKLGLQGQSWGGYQTAWLVTRTNLFKAAMAGAPVSNMTSAYGGIRWESGMSRAFQYEDGQSRIGGTLWENLPAYIENSPLFYADRVNTPLLIMSNDADGAVPWYQGIEFFSALRRLSKPVWMLVYNNGPHNLTRRADMEDFTLRMEQFFDHFLKGKPEPDWMRTGIPALQKGKQKGFGFSPQ